MFVTFKDTCSTIDFFLCVYSGDDKLRAGYLHSRGEWSSGSVCSDITWNAGSKCAALCPECSWISIM